MKTYVVAGHEFPDTVDAICIRPKSNGDPCNCAWADIEEATEDDVGQPEKAHVPNLTHNELNEIRAEKKRREEQRERAYTAIMELSAR
jgi:hypothetical protein